VFVSPLEELSPSQRAQFVDDVVQSHHYALMTYPSSKPDAANVGGGTSTLVAIGSHIAYSCATEVAH
jgi:hypothetical protein